MTHFSQYLADISPIILQPLKHFSPRGQSTIKTGITKQLNPENLHTKEYKKNIIMSRHQPLQPPISFNVDQLISHKKMLRPYLERTALKIS